MIISDYDGDKNYEEAFTMQSAPSVVFGINYYQTCFWLIAFCDTKEILIY